MEFCESRRERFFPILCCENEVFWSLLLPGVTRGHATLTNKNSFKKASLGMQNTCDILRRQKITISWNFWTLKLEFPKKRYVMPFSYFPSLQHVETLWNMTLYVFSACLSMFHMLRICSEIASKCICKVIKVQAIERFDF